MTTAKIAEAYDRRAAEYIALFGTTDKLARPDYDTITTWRDSTTGRLIDAGCGPGHWSEELTNDGVRDVVGLDASAAFIAAAQEQYPDVGFSRADLAALPLDAASVGGILAWYSIIHTPPAALPAVLSEFGRILAPGGSTLIGFFDGEPGEAFDHAVHTAYYWSADALGALLAEHGFVVEHVSTRADPGVRRLGELVARLIA